MEGDAPTILVVEDHGPTRQFLAVNLLADGYDLLEAESASQAERVIEASCPDLAILDLGLPDRDGLEVMARIREAEPVAGSIDPDLPILVLTGRSSELDRLRGFDRGCDDYLVKPFSYHELRARIAALLRRSRGRRRAGRLRIGNLELDPTSRQAWLSGQPVSLSKKEFALLRALATDPTRVFTKVAYGSPGVAPSQQLASRRRDPDRRRHT